MRHLSISRPSLLAVLVAAVLGVAAPAQASIVEAMTLADLVANADTIALGHVLSTESRWTGDGMAIVTELRFEVEREVEGCATGDILTLVTLGGVVGELGQRVDGEAELQIGEQALLFLEAQDDHFRVVGLGQGAWLVEVDEGGIAWARPQLSGLSFAAVERTGLEGKARVLSLSSAPALADEPLDHLLQRLDALCGE